MKKELYNEKADLYQKFFMQFLHYDEGVQAFLKEEIIVKTSQKILDAGTGTGIVIQALYKNLPRNRFDKLAIQAFDITPTMLTVFDQWKQKEKIKNIQLIEANVLNIDKLFSNNSFDVIFSSGMLEYLSHEDFSHAILLLQRKLKRQGKLVLFIAKKNILTFLLIKLWWRANTYTNFEIKNIVNEKYFTDILFHEFPRPYKYLNEGMFIVSAIKK